MQRFTRRAVLARGASLAAALTSPVPARATLPAPALRRIPSTGEMIPAIGLGTWITFNVGDDPVLQEACTNVLAAFFGAGGRVIDSSPMYGSAQEVVGRGLQALGAPAGLFAADKVWTSGDGPAQMERSRQLWTVPKLDLIQVHNLLSWEEHLPELLAMKERGLIRYVGITTSEGRRHDLFEEVMRTQPLDFIQVTYNVLDREVEARILPLARERGMAVMINRPFRQGALTERLAREPLPGWAAEIGANSWAQVLLKFILAHPDVTVVIPATSRADHAAENVAAATSPLPDAALRGRIADHVAAL
jgi:diketogulonate reductase-like aldo/keto reductase